MSHSSFQTLAAGLAFAAAALAPQAGQAATATTSFNVTLTVLNECVVAATPMAFGTLSLVAGAGTATSTITVTCTAQTPFTIGLNQGTAPTATIQTRLLRNLANTSQVPYSLYQDAAHTILWGNTPATVVTVPAATGLPQPFTVYGQILAGQAAALAGAYTDTIGVTVTY